ncbi:OLC1v1008654C1 [Oldenlandia corymbosa var. corymbosa]|uniref:OLC1v1008654C1 n=1 Tax=Oldenlandia corymbosa var. corymbosa TaxID=529605 RepID=A0AAV1DM23_OLDCO|nr:OLC1v1008654C1 [Oldenlandia corymbosa var. corymbosa]
MEFEHLSLWEEKVKQQNDHHPLKCRHHQAGPFHELEKDILPCSSSSSTTQSGLKKLQWLRSQIIGRDAEFDTPFGKRGLTYADHTASGRCLRYIEDYIINKVLPVYGNSHTSDSYVGCRMTKMANEASKYVKGCLGGGEEDAVMFCGSGSTAAIKRLQEVMGISVPSIIREKVLKCLNSEERWVVFVGPYEHHSNILSWRSSLAEVIEIGLDEDGLIDMDALRFQLECYKPKNRPMLGSFSACSNVTGICSDTREIARLLHQYGAFACFDFAASGPYVKIDMRSGEMDGYDAIFLSTHKFLGGPGSPGILLMNKSLYQLSSSAPSTCGGGTVDYVNGFNKKDTLYVKNVEEREEAGTPPIIQKIRAALAFWTKEYIGHDVIEKMEESYSNQALERLCSNQNIKVLGNVTSKRQAILSFLIYTTSYSPSAELIENPENSDLYLWRETGNKKDKPLHGPFVSKLLNDLFGIQARGGCACAGPYGHTLLGIDKSQSLALRSAIQMGYNGVKPGWTRISFPYYMSKEEFEFILSAVEFLAVYGQRFLPLYSFNWKTGAWNFKKKAFREAISGQENIHCDFQGTSLSDMIKELNIRCNNVWDGETHGKIQDYSNYLEAARYIAGILPKFPPQSFIPEEVDPRILIFRV